MGQVHKWKQNVHSHAVDWRPLSTCAMKHDDHQCASYDFSPSHSLYCSPAPSCPSLFPCYPYSLFISLYLAVPSVMTSDFKWPASHHHPPLQCHLPLWSLSPQFAHPLRPAPAKPPPPAALYHIARHQEPSVPPPPSPAHKKQKDTDRGDQANCDRGHHHDHACHAQVRSPGHHLIQSQGTLRNAAADTVSASSVPQKPYLSSQFPASSASSWTVASAPPLPTPTNPLLALSSPQKISPC